MKNNFTKNKYLLVVAILVFMSISCKSQKKETQAAPQPIQQVSSEPLSKNTDNQQLTFGDIQNDTIGFDGIKWGSSDKNLKLDNDRASSISDRHPDEAFPFSYPGAIISNRLLGLEPTDLYEYLRNNLAYAEPDLTSDEKEARIFRGYWFWRDLSGKNAYKYEFCAAVVDYTNGDFKKIKSMLDGKYKKVDPSDQSEEPHTILYKRDETNTRVYLIYEYGGIRRDVSIIYLPNYYYQKLRNAVIAEKNNREDARRKEETAREQAKQRAINKPIQ